MPQTKLQQGLLTRKLQSVRVGIVLPTGVRQNSRTGLVPLSGIRFAVARSLPDTSDVGAWTNPCLSRDMQSGVFDPSIGWRELYREASRQSCAFEHQLCTNPVEIILSPAYVDFYFPIGDNTVNSTHMDGRHSLYVYLDVSIENSDGRVSSTRVFAQAPLSEVSIARSCEQVEMEVSMLGTTSIDVVIGMVGVEEEWEPTMREFRDVTQKEPRHGAHPPTPASTPARCPSRPLTLARAGARLRARSTTWTRGRTACGPA